MAGKHIIQFFILLILQVFVFSNINVYGYVYPAFYVYFILLLPFETAGWLLLLSSFALGLGVDFFTNSLGINAAASVFTAFLRPGLFRLLKSKKEYVPGITPGVGDLGFRWFFLYASILIVLHHSALFFLEAFSFKDILQTLHRIIASSAATLILVLILQLLFLKQNKR
ncbi:MAG: rod shape-determining protein MreD [Bacteroidales bacterium]|nr:rod shape-determining protein MreD [Bacteroidales bacterium]